MEWLLRFPVLIVLLCCRLAASPLTLLAAGFFFATPSWENFFKASALALIGENVLGSFLAIRRNIKLYKIVLGDYVRRFPEIQYKELSLKEALSHLGVTHFDHPTLSTIDSRPGEYPLNSGLRSRARLFLAEPEGGQSFPACEVCYCPFGGTAFVFLTRSPELCRGKISEFLLLHEIGHTTEFGTGMARFKANLINIFVPIFNLLLIWMAGHSVFESPYIPIYLCCYLFWTIAFDLAVGPLHAEVCADAFAVSHASEEAIISIRRLIDKYPNIVSQGGLTIDQNQKRIDYLRQMLEMRLRGNHSPENWEVIQSLVAANWKIVGVIATLLVAAAIILFTAGGMIKQISWMTVLYLAGTVGALCLISAPKWGRLHALMTVFLCAPMKTLRGPH